MSQSAENDAPRKPTVEEAEAILTLVRGGWLRLQLTLDDSVSPPGSGDVSPSDVDDVPRAGDDAS
jgi:hypothetical protein